MITATDFLAKYPDFAILENHIIQDTIDTVSVVYCGGTPWLQRPAKRETGICFATAHLLTMNWIQTAEVVGAASSLASGSPGRSPSSVENDFSLTTYGRQFLQIKQSIPATGISMR